MRSVLNADFDRWAGLGVWEAGWQKDEILLHFTRDDIVYSEFNQTRDEKPKRMLTFNGAKEDLQFGVIMKGMRGHCEDFILP